MKYYKVLDKEGKPFNGGCGCWNLPKNGKPGKWMQPIAELVPCSRGYHLCRRKDLILWLGPEIYEAEGRGEKVVCDDKVVFSEARLLHKLKSWNERTARLLGADCAERVLPFFEKERPEDERPRKAVQAARAYAMGEIDAAARDAARAAAWAAAEDAARDAARNAARDAARAAAWAAAEAAAWAAAWAAAGAAAWAAAEAAAWAAAGDAAWAAAGAAAWAAAGEWQAGRLFEYLNGTRP